MRYKDCEVKKVVETGCKEIRDELRMKDFDNVERKLICVSVSDLEIQLSSLQIRLMIRTLTEHIFRLYWRPN
jgi:hypothetical protein